MKNRHVIMLQKFNTFVQNIMPHWLYMHVIGKWDANGFKKYFANTGWIFFGKGGNLVIGLLTTLYVARALGPTNLGELGYALSFVGIFSFIAVLGIDSVLYRELVKYPEKRDRYMGTALIIKLAAATVATFLTIASAYFFSPKDVSFVLIALLAISFIFQSFYIISYEFGAEVRGKTISVLSFLITLIVNLSKITVVLLGHGVIFLAFILVLESILYATGYVYCRYRAFGSVWRWKFDSTLAKSLIWNSWPFMFSGAFALVYARIDQIMLKNMIGATSVGLYDASVRLTELWYFIPTVIIGSLLPALINAKKQNQKEYLHRVITLTLLITVIVFVIALIMTLFSRSIVLLVFGEAFSGSILPLQIYVWALIPISLITLFNNLFLIEDFKVMLFLSSFAGMVINIASNLLLIPLYQTTGAAVATILSSMCIAVFLMIWFVYAGKLRVIR